MIREEKAPGRYVPFRCEDTVITFADRLKIDLNEFAGRYPVSIDISLDKNGELITGVGDFYLAQIELPAKKRRIRVGTPDDYGFCLLTESFEDLDMNEARLILWPYEEER